jgi:hypothetical protein
VNVPGEWRDFHTGRHPFDPAAENVIDGHTPENVIRLIRNALSHGNIVFLDKQGRENVGARMAYMAFLTPYPTKEEAEEPPTYRLLITGEEDFAHFVQHWAKWISTLPSSASLEVAA